MIYIFYQYYEGDDISQSTVNRWFYVRQKLSFDDFKKLVKNQSTVDEVIKIDDTIQIFKNIYLSAPELWEAEKDRFFAWCYLEDGIYDLAFENKKGEIVFIADQIDAEFDLENCKEPVHYPYNARILDMDWVK